MKYSAFNRMRFLSAMVILNIISANEMDMDGVQSLPSKCRPAWQRCFTEESASFPVPNDERFNSFTYFIDLKNEKSLINLTVTNRMEDNVSRTNNSNFTEIDSKTLTVLIKESIDTMDTWKFSQDDILRDINLAYISRTPNLKIEFKVGGNWSQSMMLFSYQELKQVTFQSKLEENSGKISVKEYRPNSVTIYQLITPHLMNESSITLNMHYFDLDDSMGEYLLIGAGKQPFEGPSPLFIATPKTKPQKYMVAASDAYIVFVARVLSRPTRGFEISWTRTGTKIADPDKKVDNSIPDAVLQSMPLCLYNYSYIYEFQNIEKSDSLIKLQEKITEIANAYAREEELPLITDIRASSVKIYRISGAMEPDPGRKGFENGLLYVMVKIARRFESRIAVFRFYQLQEILNRLDKYDEKTKHALLGFKVGECPVEVDYGSWQIGAFSALSILSILLLAIWVWRRNAYWKSRKFDTEESAEERRSMRKSTCILPTYEGDCMKKFKLPIIEITPNEDDDQEDVIFSRPRRRRSSIPDFKLMQEQPLTETLQLQQLQLESRQGPNNRIWQKSYTNPLFANQGDQKVTDEVCDSLESAECLEHFKKEDDTQL